MSALAARLAELRQQGLTFADCIAAFASTDPVDAAAATKAQEDYGDENTAIELPPIISADDHRGRWLMAWCWMENAELPESVLVPGVRVRYCDHEEGTIMAVACKGTGKQYDVRLVSGKTVSCSTSCLEALRTEAAAD